MKTLYERKDNLDILKGKDLDMCPYIIRLDNSDGGIHIERVPVEVWNGLEFPETPRTAEMYQMAFYVQNDVHFHQLPNGCVAFVDEQGEIFRGKIDIWFHTNKGGKLKFYSIKKSDDAIIDECIEFTQWGWVLKQDLSARFSMTL